MPKKKKPAKTCSKGEKVRNPFGASSTEDAKSAQAALKRELLKLKEMLEAHIAEKRETPGERKATKVLIADILLFYARVRISHACRSELGTIIV